MVDSKAIHLLWSVVSGPESRQYAVEDGVQKMPLLKVIENSMVHERCRDLDRVQKLVHKEYSPQ